MDKKREVAGQLPVASASLQLGRKPSTTTKPGQPNVGSFMALGRQGPNKLPDPHSPETNIYNREQWEDVAIEVNKGFCWIFKDKKFVQIFTRLNHQIC